MPLIIGETSGGVLVPIQVDDDGVMSVSAAVSSLPALPAGDNNIGNVDVVTLPALPTGTNEIGKIQANNYGLVGGSQQKDPLRFGYSAALAETVSDTDLPGTDTTIYTTAVPAGEIHVYTQINFLYIGTPPTRTWVSYYKGAVLHHLFNVIGPTSLKIYDRQGWWVLEEDDQIACIVEGPTAGDDIFLRVSGFRVDIDQ